MIDPRNVFAKLSDSRKFVVACLVLAIVGGLVALGKTSYAEFIAVAKWIGGSFILATGLEGLGGAGKPDPATSSSGSAP